MFVDVTRILTVDDLLHRAVLSSNFTSIKTLTLKAEETTCENITLDIKVCFYTLEVLSLTLTLVIIKNMGTVRIIKISDYLLMPYVF